MSKKFLYIITAVVLGIVFLMGGWFIYSASKGGSPVQDLKKLVGAVSPFGESDPFGIRKVLNSVKAQSQDFQMKQQLKYLKTPPRSCSNFPRNVLVGLLLRMY